MKKNIYCVFVLFVGYGVVVPLSNTGKIATMFYAVPGIALAITTYSYGAWGLSGITKCFLILIEIKILKRKKINYFKIKILTCQIVLTLSVLFIEAAFHSYKELENYSYLDAVYFTFVSITTIGFGDFEYNFIKHAEKPYFFVIVAFIFVIGLGLVASIVSTVADILSSSNVSIWFCKSETFHIPKSDVEVKSTSM